MMARRVRKARFRGPCLVGMAPVVGDETHAPVDVSLLGVTGVMPAARCFPHTVQEWGARKAKGLSQGHCFIF